MKRPDAFYICGEFDALLTRGWCGALRGIAR
jgi:hypothetical protein